MCYSLTSVILVYIKNRPFLQIALLMIIYSTWFIIINEYRPYDDFKAISGNKQQKLLAFFGMCILWTNAFSTGLTMVRNVNTVVWLNTTYYYISNILILSVFLNDLLPYVFNKALRLKNVLRAKFNDWRTRQKLKSKHMKKKNLEMKPRPAGAPALSVKKKKNKRVVNVKVKKVGEK